MYNPEIFSETDIAYARDLTRAHPFAMLVCAGPTGPVIDHLPLLWRGEDYLIGHIAAANPLNAMTLASDKVQVVFRGEDSYISPNWYPSKATHHKHVPTWNYQVVHLEGHIRFLADAKSKRAIVGQLTTYFERLENGDQGWRMADAPRDYMDQMLENITGFEIKVTAFNAKSKLSQNRAETDRLSVRDHLAGKGYGEMAKRMDDGRMDGDQMEQDKKDR